MKWETFSHWIGGNWQWLISVYTQLKKLWYYGQELSSEIYRPQLKEQINLTSQPPHKTIFHTVLYD